MIKNGLCGSVFPCIEFYVWLVTSLTRIIISLWEFTKNKFSPTLKGPAIDAFSDWSISNRLIHKNTDS